MFWHLLRRLWDIIVGTLMIVLSLAFQAIFFLLLTMPYIQITKWMGFEEVPIDSRFVILNGIAFVEYFRWGRANTGLGGDASTIFLLPRGVDRILTGSERIHR